MKTKTRKLKGGLNTGRMEMPEVDQDQAPDQDQDQDTADRIEEIRRNHRQRQQERQQVPPKVEVPVQEPAKVETPAETPVVTVPAVAQVPAVVETPAVEEQGDLSEGDDGRTQEEKQKERALRLSWSLILMVPCLLTACWLFGVIDWWSISLCCAVILFVGKLVANTLRDMFYGISRFNNALRIVISLGVIAPLWLAGGWAWKISVSATLTCLIIDVIVRYVKTEE